MSFYFKHFPKIDYNLLQEGINYNIKNITAAFKIREILKTKMAIYYTYDIKEDERADSIAHKYYGDATLDWVILLTNNIIDPEFDWPLGYTNFQNYIIEKYGSVENAKTKHHHYEWIVQKHEVLFDGTILKEKKFIVDKTTYDNIQVPLNKREVDAYTYEEELNNKKSTIKILDKQYISTITSMAKSVFET